MQQRIIHILCEDKEAAEKANNCINDGDDIVNRWDQKNQNSISIYLNVAEQNQELLDRLQDIAENDDAIRVIMVPVEASFPKDFEEEARQEEENQPDFFEIISREEMVEQVRGQIRVNGTYLSLVALSAVVATIALVEGNLAILIGAMVITPLIGPNLGLAFATAVGDTKMIKSSLISGTAGAALTFITALVTGLLLGSQAEKHLASTLIDYGFESIIVAICAGIAAAILLLQGTISALIGVMVAVAFLPPIAMTGLALATGHYFNSLDAAMLFAINLAAFNLAAKAVLFIAGIRPRRDDEENGYGRTIIWYIFGWAMAIIMLAIGLYFKSGTGAGAS